MPKITFSASTHLLNLIEHYEEYWANNILHGKIPYTLQTAMTRLDTQYRAEWPRFTKLFSVGEIDLIVNNARKAYDTDTIAGAVLADTENEDDSVFEAYKVDKKALIEKLKTLSISDQFSLVAWIEFIRSRLR